MKNILSIALLLLFVTTGFAQGDDAYTISIKSYQKTYTANHEVVKGKDKKYFRFFPADSNYRVTCTFEPLYDTAGFSMKTSANTLKYFTRYGRISFNVNDTPCQLFLYRSKDPQVQLAYKDLLFLPFTDASTGDESYGSGRYIDLSTADVKDNSILVDFNKAYNPYCAYATGYKCPIPPKENQLEVYIKAGERTFAKAH